MTIFSLLNLFPFASQASVISEDMMLQKIAYIVENSKYDYNGEKLPSVRIKNPLEICKNLQKEEEKIPDECNIGGYYNHFTNEIFISRIPIPPMVEEKLIETVLLHELVHFLQFVNGEYDRVQCLNELEKDAYRLQGEYVSDMGFPKEQKPNSLFVLIVSTCHPHLR